MRLASALALAALLAPAPTRAAWTSGGDRIGDGQSFVAAASGERVVVAWTRSDASGVAEVRAQCWTSEGDVAPGWPAGGVLLSALAGTIDSPGICEDGAGGAFVTWTRYQGSARDLFVQHVSATGGRASGWPAEGILLRSVAHHASPAAVAHDGEGGVLVGWGERWYDTTLQAAARIHRLGAGGAPAAGWPAEGHAIPDAYEVGLAVDDAGHFFVGTAEIVQDTDGVPGIRLRRLGADATPDPGWPQGGAFVPDSYYATSLSVLPDGTGGAFASWRLMILCVGGCDGNLPTTRILGDGTPDERWKPPRGGASHALDGKGGLLLGLATGWYPYAVPSGASLDLPPARGGRPGAVRLDASGAPMPGWSASGNPAMTEPVFTNGVLVAGDGSGGAFVAWVDSRDGSRLYASRLDAMGRLAVDWPATGSLVDGNRGGYPSLIQLVSLGGGAAVAIWRESSTEGMFGYISGLRPGEAGPKLDLGPIQVRLQRNPAIGPFDAFIRLSNGDPARVDLVDATGRQLESREVPFSWPGSVVRLNRDGGLRPGVYWMRVTQGSREAVERVILLD